jgi:hypothetical protein
MVKMQKNIIYIFLLQMPSPVALINLTQYDLKLFSLMYYVHHVLWYLKKLNL